MITAFMTFFIFCYPADKLATENLRLCLQKHGCTRKSKLLSGKRASDCSVNCSCCIQISYSDKLLVSRNRL